MTAEMHVAEDAGLSGTHGAAGPAGLPRLLPAAAVRGPKHVVKTGKTTVLTAEQARELLDSIDVSTLVGLRDRALIAVMTFAFARIGAVVAMRVQDRQRQALVGR